MTLRVAVVTIVHGRHPHLAAQVCGLAGSTQVPDQHVVVAMNDPAVSSVLRALPGEATRVVLDRGGEPDGLPLAAARNLGAAHALDGGADVLVFLDVDCVPDPRLLARYVEVAERRLGHTAPELLSGAVHYLDPAPPGGYTDVEFARSRPHPARPVIAASEVVASTDFALFWSLSFAVTGDDWRAIGGFDERYVGYGAEDTDFAWRAEQLGGRLIWVGGAPAYHQYHPTERPPAQHLIDIVRNSNLFAHAWGQLPMIGWLRQFAAMGLVELDEDSASVSLT